MTRLRDTWPYERRDVWRLGIAYLTLGVAFIAMGWPLRDGGNGAIERLDTRVATWMVEHRSTTTNTLTFLGSGLANTPVKVVVTSIIVVVMLRVWHRWFEAAYVAITLILEASVFITVTLIVRRPRPDVPRLGESNVSWSFPSGHTAAAVAYAAVAVVVFWRTTRRGPRVAAVVAAVVVPVVVGVSRVQRGLHHLSDVVAGAVLGVAVLVVTTKIALAAQDRLQT